MGKEDNVEVLRTLLGGDLPPGAKVMGERADRGLFTLRADEECPQTVTVTDFKGKRSYYASFTLAENRRAFRMIKEYFLKPESQAKLDQIWYENNGDDLRYRANLCQLLAGEVYPPILRATNLPEDQPLQLMMQCLEKAVATLEISLLWHETEVSMRNKLKIQESYWTVVKMHEECGLEPPDPPWGYSDGSDQY